MTEKIHKSLHKHIKSKHYLQICKILTQENGKARLVGGAVRDALLGVKSKDIDIATTLLPEDVINILARNNIKAIPTGIKFGTVTALIKGESFEITTLRKDLKCDGRHAEIKYSTDFKEDAMRRDFTINALSYCPQSECIYDYTNGIDDLHNKKVRFIGQPILRIEEDYLRILRFFRFSMRYANSTDVDGLAACKAHKNGIDLLSKERIKNELDGIIGQQNSYECIRNMYDAEILQMTMQAHKKALDIYLQLCFIAKQFKIKIFKNAGYAALLTSKDNVNEQELVELKFPRRSARIICDMAKSSKLSIKEQQHWLKSKWLESDFYLQYFIYLAAYASSDMQHQHKEDIIKLYKTLLKQEKPTFPIKSCDLIEIGYSGKQLGETINKLRNKWIDSDFALDKQKLLDTL